MPRKIYIRTFGCQMNVRDSEVIGGLLKNEGYAITDDPAKADVILFNTCSVRQHAEDKVWSEIGRVVKRKTSDEGREKKKSIIGLVGCMAQNYKEEAFKKASGLDFVVGPSDIAKIPAIISKLIPRPSSLFPRNLYESKIWETDGNIRPEEVYHTGFYEDKEHAYVVISEGCSNYCSYCVVPYVRGELQNRNYENILKEIEEAVDKGITKITLLGQNVNAYQATGHRPQATGYKPRKARSLEPAACSLQPETVNFIKLLEMIDNIKGLKEFSFITSHPKDTSIELFRAMQDSGKLKKYLHLPVQSGSDRVLELMNRSYTRKFYLDLIENYRKIVQNAILSTDIIVGFPTETEEDFQDTYNLVKDAQFDAAYIFKYSPRPHTEAEGLPDDVPKEEKERRHRIILDLQKEISKNKNAKS